MSKSRQSISQPLWITQHLLHLCELYNIGILPLSPKSTRCMWYHFDIWVETFSIKSKCISLVNHYSCFKSDANLLRRQYPTYLEFDVCGHKYQRTAHQSVGRDENGEDMISIFGPKSFNSFMGIEEIGVNMLPSASNGNDVANPFFPPISSKFPSTKHIFSSFQNTIRYAKPSAKAFDSFSPLTSQFVSRRREKCFRKVPSDQVKSCFFSQSWPTSKKYFRLS